MARIYADKIKECIKNTKIYTELPQTARSGGASQILVLKTDSVSAAFAHRSGKTAILNFASYKHPGGAFLMGSSAQEESLCHASFLYNVLRTFDGSYYANNRTRLNKALYRNRALYTPGVIFASPDDPVSMARFDVITCASPNYTAASKYQSVTREENTGALRDRMAFVKEVAEQNGVETLVLGAFGCGVFGQDAAEVAAIWRELFENSTIRTVVHPVPDDKNFNAFKSVFCA